MPPDRDTTRLHVTYRISCADGEDPAAKARDIAYEQTVELPADSVSPADICYRFASGGIDIIKDDHSLSDQAVAPFAERVGRCQEAVVRANRETGGTSLYFPNVTGPAAALPERADLARRTGCRGMLVSPLLVGLDAVRCLAAPGDLAVMAHPSLAGGFFHDRHGIAPAVPLGWCGGEGLQGAGRTVQGRDPANPLGRGAGRRGVQLNHPLLRDSAGRLLDARAASASARRRGAARRGSRDPGRTGIRHRPVRLRVRIARRVPPVPGHERRAAGVPLHGRSGTRPAGGRTGVSVSSINPATGETLETFAETAPAALERILDQAVAAYGAWRRFSYAQRGQAMRQAARILRERRAEDARTMALEMGKPLQQGEAEAEKGGWACEDYAEQAAAMLGDQPRVTDGSRSYVRFDPIGPVLAIMPWNFPFWQVFRFAAPALMAGNAGLLKHAPNVTRCALAIEDVFRQAGFPEGLFRTVILQNEAVAGVIADSRIRAATLTGSDRAGSQVAAQAGTHLKKMVLELGGSDPFLVLEDADVDQAARTAAEARLLNSGQSCIAAKRFIVVESVADRFLETFVSEMAARRLGDPLAPDTQLGPQARLDLRANLHRQVTESVQRGARLLLGGKLPDGPGC